MISSPRLPGHLFQRLVNERIRFSHRLDFKSRTGYSRQKFLEEQKILADMLDNQIVGIGENVRILKPRRRNAACSSIIGAMGEKMSANWLPNSVRSPRKPEWRPAPVRKMSATRDQAGFKLDQRGRTAQKHMQIFRRLRAARGNPPGGNRIVEVHQHLAQIKDNGRFHVISRRLSSARLKVSSSANSSPLPAGSPKPMRETLRPARVSRFAR